MKSDGQLDIDEFSTFLHPHNHEHMQEVLLMETFEDMDSNLDNRITFDEYLRKVCRKNILQHMSPLVTARLKNIELLASENMLIRFLNKKQDAENFWRENTGRSF